MALMDFAENAKYCVNTKEEWAVKYFDNIYFLIVWEDCFIMIRVYRRGVNKEGYYVQEDFSRFACGMSGIW